MRKILELAMDKNALYEVQYMDSKDSWTVPVILTPLRIDRILEDVSVDKVRLTFPDNY